MDRIYETFIARVAAGRNLSPEQVREVEAALDRHVGQVAPPHLAHLVLIGAAGQEIGQHGLEKMAGGAASELSKGGMLTKVLAAKVAAQTGAATVIASGRESNVLIRLMNGEKIGTCLTAC